MKKIIFTMFAVLVLAGFVFAQQNIVVPYILKAPKPITVDGVLDEWAFAFPLDHNKICIPDSGRFKTTAGWVPELDDCSGTLYMMYDDEYLYVAAHVRDNEPGHFSEASWAADAIEFYIANWDVGDALFPNVNPAGGWPNDAATGDYAVQITITFDESLDSVWVHEWYGVAKDLVTANTKVVYEIWPDGDGYNLEGKIYLADLKNATTGNNLKFEPNTRIPMTWSLYDMDETENSADFQGLAYTPKGFAGWMGVGPGWQVCDVMETPRGFEWNDMATFNFVSPYIKKVYRPVTIDGVLDEWNFCFPLDHWRSIIPDSGRFKFQNPGWLPATDEDSKGTLHMMYDDEYLYVAAHVMDNEPGHFSEASWAADAIEFYMGNYNIGDVFHPPVHPAGGWPNDATSGDYSLQITIAFDESLDSVWVHEWYGVAKDLVSDKTKVVYEIWPNGDGYNIEGKIALSEFDNATTNNTFEFTEGYRLPMTWSLYDMDETENSADFQGMAYTPKGFAGWMGIGEGWQYCDVKGVSVVEYIDVIGGKTSVKESKSAFAPKSFALEQNYPNPFNPSTNIRFSLAKASQVSLKIYNVSGQLVKTVIDNENRHAGQYEVKVDMSNLGSGIYFTVLENGSEKLQNKMMLVR